MELHKAGLRHELIDPRNENSVAAAEKLDGVMAEVVRLAGADAQTIVAAIADGKTDAVLKKIGDDRENLRSAINELDKTMSEITRALGNASLAKNVLMHRAKAQGNATQSGGGSGSQTMDTILALMHVAALLWPAAKSQQQGSSP